MTARPYFDSYAIGKVWIALAIATAIVELIGAGRRRAEATRKDRGSLLVIRVCLIPGVALLVTAPRFASGAAIRPSFTSLVVGIVALATGEALRIWAKATLGRYFTYTVMTSDDQPVITGGPYRLLRHPSYTGILLMAVGIGAAYGNWIGLAALTTTTLVGMMYRIHVEERALLEELGARYQEFAANRKRLIPFVW